MWSDDTALAVLRESLLPDAVDADPLAIAAVLLDPGTEARWLAELEGIELAELPRGERGGA